MIYVVKSLFNSDITDGLYNGFIKSLEGTKIKEDLKLIDVPGAFDIPGAVARNLNDEDCELVVTLGCVIKGETDHYHYICDAVANGNHESYIEIIEINTFWSINMSKQKSCIR